MNKISILLIISASLMLFACTSKTNIDQALLGEWGDCNGWSKNNLITITQQNDILILHANNNDYVLEKKADDLYTADGGIITLIKDNRHALEKFKISQFFKTGDSVHIDTTQKNWSLTGISAQAIRLCRRNEVN